MRIQRTRPALARAAVRCNEGLGRGCPTALTPAGHRADDKLHPLEEWYAKPGHRLALRPGWAMRRGERLRLEGAAAGDLVVPAVVAVNFNLLPLRWPNDRCSADASRARAGRGPLQHSC